MITNNVRRGYSANSTGSYQGQPVTDDEAGIWSDLHLEESGNYQHERRVEPGGIVLDANEERLRNYYSMQLRRIEDQLNNRKRLDYYIPDMVNGFKRTRR